MIFEIQRFADENDFDDSIETAESAEVESTEEQAEQAELPPEFEGLDDDLKQEAMQEILAMQSDQENEESEENQNQQQPPPSQPSKPSTVSYEEYQAKAAEAERYKAMIAQYQNQQQIQQPQQPPTPQQPQPQTQQQFRMTPELAAQINQYVDAEALRMTGLTKDDLASFEWAEANDPKVLSWKFAQAKAREDVFNAIRQAQINKVNREQQSRVERRETVIDFNNFVNQKQSQKDYQQVADYAVNDYFRSLNPQDQKIVANSFLRIQKGIAEANDVYVIKTYYGNAEIDYRSNRRKQGKTQKPPNLPKIDQIGGSSTTIDGEMSAADIEKLIDSGDLDKIPKKIREQFDNAPFFK